MRIPAVVMLCGLVLMAGCGDGSATPSMNSSPVSTVRGTAFTDPEKTYTITLDKEWKATKSPSQGVEAWFVAPAKGGFSSNVNIVTQGSQGASLSQYMELILKTMGTAKIVKHEMINGAGGRQLGQIEFTQSMPVNGSTTCLTE